MNNIVGSLHVNLFIVKVNYLVDEAILAFMDPNSNSSVMQYFSHPKIFQPVLKWIQKRKLGRHLIDRAQWESDTKRRNI
jgi:hypothetical protein